MNKELTLQEVKDQVAREYGHENFSSVKNKYRSGTLHVGDLISFVDLANKRFFGQFSDQQFKRGWLKVSERLPEDEKQVLLYADDIIEKGYLYQIEPRIFRWKIYTQGMAELSLKLKAVTHWQYLPTPPKETEG